MNFQNGNRWKAVLFLSVILPMSFLVTFKLSGLTGGPATLAETVVLEPARWESERPYFGLYFNDRVESVYSADIWMNNSVTVEGFTAESAFGGSPAMGIKASLTAHVENGYVENVNLTFIDGYDLSLINMYELDGGGRETGWAVWDNLTATDYAYWMRGTEKGFVNLRGVNNPQGIYLFVGLGWLLESPNNQTQQLTMRVEVTYFNGTAYRRVVQPFQITLVADNDNTFDTAKEIEANSTLVDFLGGDYRGADWQDYYKVYMETGDCVNITMTPPLGTNFDLYLYDSDKSTPTASSKNGPSIAESISFVIDTTDWWFIKVQLNGGDGIYTLNVTIVKAGTK